MALTMTRTRTQTTLTKLATQLARINGELEAFREGFQDDRSIAGTAHARIATLERQREAVVLTLQQFDRLIDVSAIASRKLNGK